MQFKSDSECNVRTRLWTCGHFICYWKLFYTFDFDLFALWSVHQCFACSSVSRTSFRLRFIASRTERNQLDVWTWKLFIRWWWFDDADATLYIFSLIQFKLATMIQVKPIYLRQNCNKKTTTQWQPIIVRLW